MSAMMKRRCDQGCSSHHIEKGEFTGIIHNHERYGLYFSKPIGYRIDADGSRILLYYGEIKLSGERYHVIPRTRPSQ